MVRVSEIDPAYRVFFVVPIRVCQHSSLIVASFEFFELTIFPSRPIPTSNLYVSGVRSAFPPTVSFLFSLDETPLLSFFYYWSSSCVLKICIKVRVCVLVFFFLAAKW